MYKQILIHIYINILAITLAFSQSEKKTILIYTEGKGYLESYIEKSIKNLHNIETDSTYFSSVSSFNKIYSNNKYQAQLSELIRTQKDNNEPVNLSYTKDEIEIRKRIFDRLSNYKYFLTITTNTLGELIEFQFQLFETIHPKADTSFNIPDNVIGTENFFINPKDEKYYSTIEEALQRLFKQSNREPEAELNIFGRVFKDNSSENEINLPMNTSITFDGSNSGDFDNDNISYIWRNIIRKNEKYQTSKKIIFKQDLAKQSITISDSGKYKIGFKVYDGINYSKEIILNIKANKKLAKTIMLDSTKYSINYFGMLNTLNFKNKHQQTFFCEKLNDNDSLNKKIIITKIPIENRYFEYIDKSIIYESYKFDYESPLRSNYYFSKIEIESVFNNFKSNDNEKIYYVYDLNNENLAYNQRIIKHKLRNRNVISLGLRYENSTIFSHNQEKEFIIDSFSLLINILLTSKLEFEFAVPYPNSKTLAIENSPVKYPTFLNVALRYFIIDLNKTKVLDGIKPFVSFGVKSLTNASPINYVGVKGSSFFCYTPGLGIERSIKNFDFFDLSIRVSGQYGFFDNTYLKDYKLLSGSLDCVFRF